MARVLTAGLAATIVLAVLGWAALPVAASRLFPARQIVDAEVVEAASGPLGERSLSFTARSTTTPDGITLAGYLTSVAGLGPDELFVNGEALPQAARFTITAELAIDAAESRADITDVSASGTLQVHFNEAAGADWADPESFAAGSVMAEYAMTLRETLHRQAPGVGLAVGEGRIAQSRAETFSSGGATYQFGHDGLEQRWRYVGAQQPGEPATIGLIGSAFVSSRESITVSVGGPQSVTEPATPAADDLCAPWQPWLGQTRENLTRARTGLTTVDPVAELEALDAGVVRQAADDAAALASAQRAAEIPDGAAEAHQLTVTALSTVARGLQSSVEAVEAGDPELLAQAQQVLRDGASLLQRAESAAASLAPGCEG